MNQNSSISKPFFNATTDKIDFANLCVIGIPWDTSSSFRKGAKLAPEVIRRATSGELYNSIAETGINLVDAWRIYDAGDAKISSKTAIEARSEVYQTLLNNNRYSMQFLFLGGDHLSTYFSYWSLKKLSEKKIGLIYLDAHPDLYEDYEGDKYSHACVVKRIIEEANIDPETIIQVGVRAPTPTQLEYAENTGIKIISTKEFQSNGASETAETVGEYLANNLDTVYLSIDLDVLDPAYAPGVGNPQPGGLSTRELIDFIHGLQDLQIYAFDVVELCPEYDPSGITAFAAAKLIQETLGTTAKR